ncbi:MAG: hypothetical protein OXB98_05440 [Bryobacterales bacterium]|nr:hypothetical protein [Bryobacterales bacterium]
MRNMKIVLLALLCALPLAAQSDQDLPPALRRALDRFQLFNACQPMSLMTGLLNADDADIGVTEGALRAAAESRLQSARLYTEDGFMTGSPVLTVRVNVVGLAFAVDVRFEKIVYDVFENQGRTMTWQASSLGTQGRNAGNIMTALSQHLDKSLAEYLRVNEAACESR